MNLSFYLSILSFWPSCIQALTSNSSPKLTSVVLKVSYDGSRFFGWKATNDGTPIIYDSSDNSPSTFYYDPRQRSRRRNHSSSFMEKKPTVIRSVVGELKKAFVKIYGDVESSRIQIEGSSRTDRGVHAHGYPPTPRTPEDDTHFRPLPFQGDLDKLVFVLNRMLTADVRVMDVSPLPYVKHSDYFVPHAFHPSINAISKTYKYTISMGSIHDPLRCRHVWHVDDFCGDFNLSQAKLCCQLFMGSHDFQAFRGSNEDSSRQGNTIRTISNLRIMKSPSEGETIVDGLIQPFPSSQRNRTNNYQIFVTGDRFMYKMVRILVGAIVAVGMGKESLESVQQVLYEGRGDRYKLCAPAHGLALLNVSYPSNYVFRWLHNI